MPEKKKSDSCLTGKMVVAMPNMKDPRFENTVIFICGHDQSGAMGLVINKLVENITLNSLLEQLQIEIEEVIEDKPIYYGGPVEMGRGFVLHSAEYTHDSSVKIGDDLMLTATIEILRDIARSKGPEKCLLALGYAGWSPGQLEQEIQSNCWLEVEADNQVLFETPLDQRWKKTLLNLGIDPAMLSVEAGHA